jgi:MFS family permease
LHAGVFTITDAVLQGFLIEGGLGWRWVFWILCIMSGTLSLLGLRFMPETVSVPITSRFPISNNPSQYAPVLLRKRAQKLNETSGGTLYFVSRYDVGRDETVIQKLSLNMRRPFGAHPPTSHLKR